MSENEESLLSHRLKIAIDRKRVSRAEIAKRAGISVQAISNYINGNRKPEYEILAKLSEALNVSADWLVGLSEVPLPDITVQAIHRALGISETAIVNLMELKSRNCQERLDIISEMLSIPQFSPSHTGKNCHLPAKQTDTKRDRSEETGIDG